MYIVQHDGIFTKEDCDTILNKRIDESFDGEKLNDLLVFKENRQDWSEIFDIIHKKSDSLIDAYISSFLDLMPKYHIDISHIGFLNDNFGSFTELHYDWEMVKYKGKTIAKPFVMLIYLSGGYTGGELHFPIQNKTLKPSQGTVAIFPCNFAFPHVSQPILEGSKHVCRVTYRIEESCYEVDELEI